jgi:hypothetical protein
MTIQDALNKMRDGHYLHLPVKSLSGSIVVGLVDVLTLTYHTMEQLLQQQSFKPDLSDSGNIVDKSGPLWHKFWESTDICNTSNEDFASDLHSEKMKIEIPENVSICGSQSATTVAQGHFDQTGFVFKFRDPFTNKVHRSTCSIVKNDDCPSPILALLESVLKKCELEIAMSEITKVEDFIDEPDRYRRLTTFYEEKGYVPIQSLHRDIEGISYAKLSYKDDDNDYIHIYNDTDLEASVEMARKMGWARVIISLNLGILTKDGKLIWNGIGSPDIKADSRSNSPEITKLLRPNDISVWVGVGGLLIGALGVGMMVASKLKPSS